VEGRWRCAICSKRHRRCGSLPRIVAHENDADAIAREVLIRVRRSFISPRPQHIVDLIGLLDAPIGPDAEDRQGDHAVPGP